MQLELISILFGMTVGYALGILTVVAVKRDSKKKVNT